VLCESLKYLTITQCIYKETSNCKKNKQQTQFNLDPNRNYLTLFFLITYQAMIRSAYTYLR